jgi:chain length determinant protein (polysaccharide antigen chain regulator)
MQEEISLRELIEVIIKGKKLIIGITIIALIIAAILSYFVIKPSYETKATILVNNNSFQQEAGEELSAYLNEVVSTQVYSQRIKSQQLLKQVIENYDLKEWTVRKLQNNLKVETEKDSKIVTLTLKGNDPELIHKTLELIVRESNTYIGDSISNRMLSVADQYKAQLGEEKEKLDAALEEYNKAQVDEGLPSIVLLDALTKEDKQYLINIDEKYLDELQNIDKNKQVEFQKLNNQVNALTDLYNKYNEKYEEARSLAKLFNLENVLTIVSEPELPEDPVSPNKTLNMAIAFVLSLMVSIAVLFSQHYWKETNKGSK